MFSKIKAVLPRRIFYAVLPLLSVVAFVYPSFTTPALASYFSPQAVINQPKITRLSPPSGASGTQVTVIGSGFGADTTVSIGGIVVSATVKPNDRALVFTVPNLRVGSATIIVNNPGTIEASTVFQVLPSLVFTPPTIPQVEAGQSLSVQLAATGGKSPYTFSTVGALPSGVSLSSTGLINGSPTQSGDFTATLVATDNNHLSVQTKVTFIVTPGPTITTQTLPLVVQGENFSDILSALGGTPPYSWYIAKGAIPGGLLLTSNGILQGRPGVPGVYAIDVKVVDSIGASSTLTFSFTVKAPPPPPQSVLLVSRGGRFGSYASSTAVPLQVPTNGHLPGITVGIAELAGSSGYFAANSVGRVTTFDANSALRSVPRRKLQGRIIALASDPSAAGYWLLSNKGIIYRGGKAKFYKTYLSNAPIKVKHSIPGTPLAHQHLVGIASAPHGSGYWVVGSNGSLWGFGAAKRLVPFYLRTTVRANHSRVVAIASAKVGIGFYLLLADGEVLSFGSAVNYGSPATRLAGATNIIIAPGGKGYWLLTGTGQLLPFGQATSLTFVSGDNLNNSVIGGLSER
ncbi:MAG: putative Ig domain-containing protein [Firmicutes bacterium]|nr:putative Ig domain-containing protein [Bacillota bacterium]